MDPATNQRWLLDATPDFREQLHRLDVAAPVAGKPGLDGTFFAQCELPGRDMRGIPHPEIVESMDRFESLSDAGKAKVRFIHFNHTNPVLEVDGEARREVIGRGFRVAEEGEVEDL